MERHIIWDVDGTLIDTRQAVATSYLYALKSVGILETDGARIFPYVGRRSSLVFTECHHLEGDVLQKALAIYASFFESEGLSMCAPYCGIKELLEELKKRGAVMTVASARSKRQLDMLFSRLDVAKYFDLIRATETNLIPADKPKLVRECIDFMGMQPHDCVMVGDRIYDIQGGQVSGTRSIGVTFGFGSREELLACAPDSIVDDIASLRSLLLGEQ